MIDAIKLSLVPNFMSAIKKVSENVAKGMYVHLKNPLNSE